MNTVTVVSQSGYRSLRATGELAAGATIFSIDGEEVPLPSRHSVQVGRERHILPHHPGVLELSASEPISPEKPGPSMWQFMNHSCDPNVCVDTGHRSFLALRDIRAGEELTFNYNTTEWDMAEPFDCNCSSVSCVGTVRGFSHLPEFLQALLIADCAPHIRELASDLACCGDKSVSSRPVAS